MKIIELKISNIKKIKAIEIRPEESLIEITGRNGQGKTSVLDSIAMAFCGKSLQPERTIRDGEESARVEIDVGEFRIIRNWTSNEKSYLTIESKDRAKYPAPQAKLDKLIGSLSFDPLEFSRMESKKQKEILQKLIGIDFSELDNKRAGLFEERRRLNVDIRDMEGKIKSMPYAQDVGVDELNITELLEEQKNAFAIIKLKEQKERETQQSITLSIKLHEECALIDKQISALKNKFEDIRNKIEEEEKKNELLLHEVATINAPDLDAINFKIKNANEINQTVKNNQAKIELQKQYETKAFESSNLTNHLTAVDEAKLQLLQEAKFPIEGLSIDDNGVSFGGIPFSQCSAAEQLKISVSMGLALNPSVRVILIRDGSLLDNENLKVITEMAALNDAQIWIERVADSEGAGIYIEDGQIKN